MGRRRALGLELRFCWGERNVGEYFLGPGKPAAFKVGSAPGVDFPMGDARLGGRSFEVVRGGKEGFQVRFTSRMDGALERGGQRLALPELRELGLAEPDEDAFAISLKAGDRVELELGGVRLEAFFQPVPRPVLLELGERLDYGALSVFLVVFSLAAGLVIAALERAEDALAFADELERPPAEVLKIGVRLALAPPNRLAERLRARRVDPPARHQGPEGKAGSKRQSGEGRRFAAASKVPGAGQLLRELWAGPGGAAEGVLAAGLGGELQAAMGELSGARVGSARGLEGLGLRGLDGGGGGTGRTVGIGPLGTRGRGANELGYGDRPGGLPGAKEKPDLPVPEDPVVCGSGGLACGLDRDLIRGVIRAHRGQIRFCYESGLTRNPSLSGKVAVRFVIGPTGQVGRSEVTLSTAQDSALESCVAARVRGWVFPKPKTGGVVVVTYPFLFKSAGE